MRQPDSVQVYSVIYLAHASVQFDEAAHLFKYMRRCQRQYGSLSIVYIAYRMCLAMCYVGQQRGDRGQSIYSRCGFVQRDRGRVECFVRAM